jgi:hypothetical protein
MSSLIKPVNATSVGSLISGAPGPKNVAGMTLRAALMTGNQSLLMATLGRGGQMPQAGIDGGQDDTQGQDDDDSKQ